jgi:hypothetical protein
MDSGPAPRGASRNDELGRNRGRFVIRSERRICDNLPHNITRHPWRCNSGQTANTATRTFRHILRKRASAAMSARSARAASRPSCTMCARTAAAVLRRGRSVRRRNGVRDCASRRVRRRTNAYISNTALKISRRIRRASGILRLRIVELLSPSSWPCPGRGAAFFTMHRRVGTVTSTALFCGPGSAADRKSAALRPGHVIAEADAVAVALAPAAHHK